MLAVIQMVSKKPPVVLDPKHPAAARPENPQVAAYKKGVAERAAAQRELRPPVPNLAQANELYKPGKDAPMTMATIGKAQKAMEGGAAPSEPRGLSQQTIEGLQALHGAMAAQRSQQTMSETQADLPAPPMPEAPPAAPPPTKPAETTKPVDDGKKAKLRDTLAEMDDLEFDRVLRSVQHDAINNEKERESVKKRVKPIDLLAGISSGVFVQDVPIIPETLVVRYRTITAMENQSIRLMLFKMIDEDKRRENIAAELYGLMQTVCAVHMINNKALPPHIKGEGYQAEFDEAGFLLKFNQFIRYPLVMLHAIGTHGYWFEQRVRDAFTTDLVKNG
jgi:hypothetical protein